MIHELLGCPFPSVAAILLQQLKQLIAESWPPPPEPVQLAVQWLQACATCQPIERLFIKEDNSSIVII